MNSVGLSRLERIQLRLGDVTEADGLEGEYLGITKGIRRRRVSIDESLSRCQREPNRPDSHHGGRRWTIGTMHVVATLRRMKHRHRRGVRDCSRVMAVGNPQARRARDRTMRLDEPHSPVAGFHSTGRRAVGLEQPLPSRRGCCARPTRRCATR